MKLTQISILIAAALPMTSAAAEKPNIIVILADDLGYSDLGAYGGEIQTPNLDKLAEDGRKFTQFYNTARCCPSRASLLTGLYPHQAGVGHMLWNTGYPGYQTRLTSDSVTMAEVLHDAGYATYMTGKWHLAERVANPADPTGWPLQRGFDKFYGTLAGYGSFYDPATLCRDNTYITPENDPEYKTDSYYYTDAISDNAVKYLSDHVKAQAGKPLMMYVAYTAAHWPLHVPEDSLAEYKGKYDAGYDVTRQARMKRMEQLGLMQHVGQPSPTTGNWDAVKDKAWEAGRMEAYAAMITRMDQGIGKIIEQLRQSEQLDNTMVLFMQDNGGCDEEFFMNNKKAPENLHVMGPDELQSRTLLPMQTRDGRVVKAGEGVKTGPDDSFNGYGPAWANVSNTPFRLVKKHAHEGGISTPLIVHWPAGLPKNNDYVTAPAHLIDIMPTVVDAAGATYPAERSGHKIQPMEGESLLPLLTDKGEFHRENPIFWEHEGSRAVRKGPWKLVAEPDAPWELYNIDNDRGEMNNLANVNPGMVEELTADWNSYAKRTKVDPYGAHRLRDRQPDPENAPAKLSLVTGDVYPRPNALALSDVGLSITAYIKEMAPEGVIVAQGAGRSGYSLYAKDGKVHFVAQRVDKLFHLASAAVPEKVPAVIKVHYAPEGSVGLKVNDGEWVNANFYGPLLETPNEALTVGFDQYTPVGEYPEEFSFKGYIDHVEIETLK